jgi:hypothetical protein
LPKKDLSVDVDNEFKPVYEVIEGKRKLIGELKTAAKGVANVYLAADPGSRGRSYLLPSPGRARNQERTQILPGDVQ